MKLVIPGIITLMVLLGSAYWVNTYKSRPAAAPSEVRQPFQTVTKELVSGAKLYDVRTPEEFAAGHFVGAENVPLQDIEAGKLPAVDKSTKISLYCRSGNRSSQAAMLLKDAGFTNIIDLGGLSDVQSMGGTLVQ